MQVFKISLPKRGFISFTCYCNEITTYKSNSWPIRTFTTTLYLCIFKTYHFKVKKMLMFWRGKGCDTFVHNKQSSKYLLIKKYLLGWLPIMFWHPASFHCYAYYLSVSGQCFKIYCYPKNGVLYTVLNVLY